MNFLLTSSFDDCFEYQGKILHLDFSFDNVLRMFELLQDDAFRENEKVDIALEMLLEEYSFIEKKSTHEKYELFLFILKEFLDIDLTNNNGETQKLYDFSKDAGLIYASFFRAYRIDLFEQHGKLHWHKFIQLFTHFDDKSKFKEVVSIRQMKIPAVDKHNKEYRDYVISMKRAYNLDNSQNEEDAVKAIDQKWNALAQSLKPRG